MISAIFGAIVYNPLYNSLIGLMNLIPGGDLGIAIILLTIIVRLILFPLSRQAVKTQQAMKEIETPLKEIREKYKNDQQKLAQEMMALYKQYKINPFSSLLLIAIQIPIILGLFWIFSKGGLPEVNPDILYPFVAIPEFININFLGLIDITQSQIISLSLAAAVTQYLHARYAFSRVKVNKKFTGSFKDDFAKTMSVQMRYVLPVFILFVAYSIVGAVGLYWAVSNLFTLGQEVYVRKQMDREENKSSSNS